MPVAASDQLFTTSNERRLDVRVDCSFMCFSKKGGIGGSAVVLIVSE